MKSSVFLSLLLAALAGLPAPARALDVSGVIERDTVWTPAAGTLRVTGNLMIKDSILLTIQPGTVLEFMGYYQLLIRGRLEARGTPEKPVVFTSGLNLKSASNWKGLVFFGPQSGGILENVVVEYAYKNLVRKCAPSITRGLFQNNAYGIYFSYSTSAKLTETLVTQNNYGVYCDYSSPILTRNRITANDYGIYLILSAAPVMTQNEIQANKDKDVFEDQVMGESKDGNVNDRVWDLMKDLF
jgi:parallel beta-helix repeat protein